MLSSPPTIYHSVAALHNAMLRCVQGKIAVLETAPLAMLILAPFGGAFMTMRPDSPRRRDLR
jgi:hypothetical protein